MSWFLKFDFIGMRLDCFVDGQLFGFYFLFELVSDLLRLFGLFVFLKVLFFYGDLFISIFLEIWMFVLHWGGL